MLGIDDDEELQSAISEALESAFEECVISKRPMQRSEHAKAFSVLGEDPSHDRLKKKFGLSDKQVP